MSLTLVSLSAFSNLAGSALASDIRRLLINPCYTHLVLFADVAGEQLAILPVGPTETYRELGSLHGVELEGLRPLCALRTQVDVVPQAVAQAPARTDEEEARLAAREKDLKRIADSLSSREQYIAECEKSMAQVGQNLAEREAMVDQREQMIMEKEREFFRRSGDVVRQPTVATPEPQPQVRKG